MKKQLILILSLILLVGATIGILVIVNNVEANQKEEAERIEQEKVLMSLNSNNINKIEIKTADTVYTAVLDENSKWTLENKVDFEVNSYYLNSFAAQLSTLTADEIICPLEEADLAGYQLDDPVNVITIYENDTPYVINVGKLSNTGDFYYVTIDGRDNVYGVSADYADYLYADKNSLKSIYILRESNSAIDSVSLTAHGKLVYDIRMNSAGSWDMYEPLKMSDRINLSNVNSLLTTIRQMIVDKFGDEHIQESQYKDYGFDDPEYVFTFTQENGNTTNLLVQDYEPDGTSFVTLLCKETGQIFYMQSNYTDFLQDTADEFIIKAIYTHQRQDIAKLNIKWNERIDADITIDEESGSYTLNGKSLKEDAASALDNFCSKISALKYDALVLECPANENAVPEISVTYTNKDGTKNVFTFCKSDSENYAVFMDGEYQYFTVSKKNFTAREGIYDYFDRLLDAAGIE